MEPNRPYIVYDKRKPTLNELVNPLPIIDKGPVLYNNNPVERPWDEYNRHAVFIVYETCMEETPADGERLILNGATLEYNGLFIGKNYIKWGDVGVTPANEPALEHYDNSNYAIIMVEQLGNTLPIKNSDLNNFLAERGYRASEKRRSPYYDLIEHRMNVARINILSGNVNGEYLVDGVVWSNITLMGDDYAMTPFKAEFQKRMLEKYPNGHVDPRGPTTMSFFFFVPKRDVL